MKKGTTGGENRPSDCLIGKAQVQDAAKASFFGTEETGKAKPDPFGTTGTHNGIVNHDGGIILGRMKFQHHVASHRKALARGNTAPSEGQIRHCPFHDDVLAWIMDGTDLCRVLDRDPVIIAARIGPEFAEEGGKPMATELTAKGIDGQRAKKPVSHPAAWGEFCLQRPAFWTTAAAHGRR
jgi:hypothetical protein